MIGKFINFFSGKKYPSKITLDRGFGVDRMGRSERDLYKQFEENIIDSFIDFFDKYDISYSNLRMIESLKYPVILCGVIMDDLYAKDDITNIVQSEVYPILKFIESINGCELTIPYFYSSASGAMLSYMPKDTFKPHFYIGKDICVYEHSSGNVIKSCIMFTFENPHYNKFNYDKS